MEVPDPRRSLMDQPRKETIQTGPQHAMYSLHGTRHNLQKHLSKSSRNIFYNLFISMSTSKSITGITTDDQTNAAQRRAAGEFVRGVSTARNWIDKASSLYPPASGRYHLIVAYNCPWCHRVLLGRSLLGLQDAISVDVLFPNRSNADEPLGENLWKFCPDGAIVTNGNFVQFPECTADTVMGGKTYVKEIYQACGIDDQKSVPILFDKQTKTIVNNESSEILRMMETAMMDFSTTKLSLYPESLRDDIGKMNDYVYTEIANGSYKAGFSSSQKKYEEAYTKFFAALDYLNDKVLSQSKFLVSNDTVTEADVRLFPPLFRFDPVYYSRMKLNKKHMWEYPHIWRWMSDMMALEGMEQVANASYLLHCKQGYFGRTGNGTVPIGPDAYPECYKEPSWRP